MTSALIAVSMSLAVDFATFDGALVIQYMSQLLQIDPITIKVVSVHSGSTIAEYTIAGASNVTGNATLNAQYLGQVATNLVNIVQSGKFTAATGYVVTSMTVTPPSVNGTAPASAIVSSPPSAPLLTPAEAAGIATGVVIGVVVAIIIAVLLAVCAGGYVVRQRRLAAASASVYSAKEGIELPEAKLSEKMKAKNVPPPIIARKESIVSTVLSSSQVRAHPQLLSHLLLHQRRESPRVLRHTQPGRTRSGRWGGVRGGRVVQPAIPSRAGGGGRRLPVQGHSRQ